MKRKLVLLLCLILALCLFASCKDDETPNKDVPFGQADNEILTYDKIDYSKTQLLLSVTGNIQTGKLNSDFMKKYPDIQIVTVDLTGGESGFVPAEYAVSSGSISPDIMLTAYNLLSDDFLTTYCTDLSGNSVTSRFQTAALQNVAIDERVFSLPGLSKLVAMAYNKTLFTENGWEVPRTFSELITLCNKINNDTDIEALNPNAKYSNEIDSLLEALCYGEVFAGVDNRQWLNDFISGKATYSEHMQPMYDVMSALINNDIVNEGHFSYSATTRGKEFQEGKIAMINSTVSKLVCPEYEFGYFPFPGKTEDDAWIIESMESEIAVVKKERSSAVQDAVNKYLDFYSSPQGQASFIDTSALTSNLQLSLFSSAPSPLIAELTDTINAGHLFSSVQFYDDSHSLSLSFRNEMLELLKGTRTAAQSMAYVDSNCRSARVADVYDYVATASENFTVLEVSNLFADMFREETGADIGLIPNNVAYRGNLMRITTGNINSLTVKVLKPRSYANDSKLVKVKMTGGQLLAALNEPVGNESIANCVYAVSGLKCVVKPWNDVGSMMVSTTLADGTAIENNKLYTVAFWEGTVYDKFITETVQTYENYNNSTTEPDSSFTALLTKYLKAKGTIAPAKDGRVTILWA